MSSASNSAGATGRIDSVGNPRPVRVAFPVHVSFDGANFHVDEFTANLSVGGIFLPAAVHIPVRTRGSLTFRLSQWEEPFTVEAEVAWSTPPDQVQENHPAGVGLMFLDLSDDHRHRLGRLVNGIQDGSVTEAIRRSITRPGVNLLKELRKRPTDQKVMFALAARNTEIDALIQDSNPAAVLRLLSNPRTALRHVHKILKDPRTQVNILLEILKEQKWMRDGQARMLFCMHPLAPLNKVRELLPLIPLSGLKRLAANRGLRKPLLDQADRLLKSRSR
jgi:uncharacterized protein (TIGR02266 family)